MYPEKNINGEERLTSEVFDKNTLYQYQGGGYDGCFWEWNFFYIDHNGTFHDIFSSGRNGCDTEEKALEYIEKESTSNFYVIHLDNEDEIKEFSKETNSILVKDVIKWFEKYDTLNPVNIYAVCSNCGNKIECSSDIYMDGEYNPQNILCECCYFDGHCSCCESYVGQENMNWEKEDFKEDKELVDKVLEDLSDEFGPICKDCFANALDGEKNKQRKDLFNQSLLTGEPDLFSEEMRDYWEGK